MLLANAVLRMASLGNVPYFIAGDFNIDPLKSQVIRAAIADGALVDITAAHAPAPDRLQATFCNQGPTEGMDGAGVHLDRRGHR